MRSVICVLAIIVLLSPSAIAQGTFNPVTKTGNLGNVDAGAIMNYYTNPSVPDTYEFIDPKDVGLPDEDPSSVINVEKMDVYGTIKVNPESKDEPEN